MGWRHMTLELRHLLCTSAILELSIFPKPHLTILTDQK